MTLVTTLLGRSELLNSSTGFSFVSSVDFTSLSIHCIIIFTLSNGAEIVFLWFHILRSAEKLFIVRYRIPYNMDHIPLIRAQRMPRGQTPRKNMLLRLRVQLFSPNHFERFHYKPVHQGLKLSYFALGLLE